VSQHLEVGGPFDVAEHGEELLAPDWIVVDVIAIGADGGEGGVDETLLWNKKNINKIITERPYELIIIKQKKKHIFSLIFAVGNFQKKINLKWSYQSFRMK
jgi:hypothetical protein